MSAVLPGFEPYANATLFAEVAEAASLTGWTVDPSTGNPIPSSASAVNAQAPLRTVAYTAHLKNRGGPRYEKLTGADQTTLYLEGVLLNPWQFDELVKPNQLFRATYNGLSGTFELLPEHSILPEFNVFLGTRLYGVFRMAGATNIP